MRKPDFFDMHSGNRMNDLKQVLFNEYGGFADKKKNRLEGVRMFIIDNRSERDFGAKGKLYSYFCMIFAEVLSTDQVKVSLSGNVPLSTGVKMWINDNDAEFTEGRYQNSHSLSFIVEKGNEQILGTLASAIQSIVAPRKRYEPANYKYVCPRTAISLRRLMSVLKRAWNK